MFDGKVLLREDSLIFGGKVFIEGGFLNIWGQGLIEGRFIINIVDNHDDQVCDDHGDHDVDHDYDQMDGLDLISIKSGWTPR